MMLADKAHCTGCAACANVCTEEAICMEPDATGFLFPVINDQKCINCGACETVCPALNKLPGNAERLQRFIVQNRDHEIRRQSTSGGAFTAIAEQVINCGGIVFGAAFQDAFHVAHTSAETVDDIGKFRNSKYVQSEIGDCFTQAKAQLENDRWVCFSGTPCQIQGLKKFLGEAYEKLITVDFMCRAVPSPKIFRKYMNYQEERISNVAQVVFRDKMWGYSYSQLAIYSRNTHSGKPAYHKDSKADPWLRLFFGGYCNRESCYSCPFQEGARPADITLWDCWNTYAYAPDLDDNKGTTNVITWTDNGLAFIQQSNVSIKTVDTKRFPVKLSRGVLPRAKIDVERFYTDADILSAKAFIHKYVQTTLNIRLRSFTRTALYKLHLHDVLQRLVHTARRWKN